MATEMQQKTESREQIKPKNDTILRIDNISKHFGEIRAVDEVSLTITDGEVHSIIGPNGAGKTTMFNLITGTLKPTSGDVFFKGENVSDMSLDERARLGMSRVFQSAEIFPQLTIRENARLARQAIQQSFNPFKKTNPNHTDHAERILKNMEFNESIDTKVSNLSHGDKKRLEIGMGLATEPEILLLDEPTSGVSQEDSERIIKQLDEMAQDTTVLLIEHDIDIVMSISDVITVMDSGQKISQGVPEEIQTDQKVQEAYLGGVA